MFKRAPEFEDFEEAEPDFELLKLGPTEEFKEVLPSTLPSPFESWDDFDGFRGSLPNICLIISTKSLSLTLIHNNQRFQPETQLKP